MPRKKQTREKASIEDIYRNKNFVPPKEKHLETIFEEPRQTKDGVPILTSVKKYKRYLHFDPTQNKIQKRKRNAKKCLKKLKSSYRVTRSSPKNSKSDDTLMYLMEVLSESDEESYMDESSGSNRTKLSGIFPSHESKSSAEATCTSSSTHGVFSPDYCDTPKRTVEGRKSQILYKSDIETEIASDILNNNSEEVKDPDESQKFSSIESPEDANSTESPRRSCYIS